MAWDWLSPAISGTVGVGGLFFGWLSGKQSRDQAERLAEHNNEHARLMAEQRDAHTRLLEDDRRGFEQRMVEEERRQQRLAEAYLEIMTTTIQIGYSLRPAVTPKTTAETPKTTADDSQPGVVAVREELVRATALAETFASADVNGLFESWRDLVYKVLEADVRFAANADTGQPGHTAIDMRLHWRRQARDLRLREADQRKALADLVATELRARRRAAATDRDTTGKSGMDRDTSDKNGR
jgi:hypothetical protein